MKNDENECEEDSERDDNLSLDQIIVDSSAVECAGIWYFLMVLSASAAKNVKIFSLVGEKKWIVKGWKQK